MTIATSITRRERTRVLTSGAVVVHARYVLNFRDPRTGQRRQLFFRSQREAIAKRDSLLASVATNSYTHQTRDLTVAEAIDHWLDNRRGEVKAVTFGTYKLIATRCIVGPLKVPDIHAPLGRGDDAPGHHATKLLETLGSLRTADLTTAEIRRWHRMIMTNIGARTATVAKTILKSALSLAAEDFGVRPPPMPTRLGKGKAKAKRLILTPAQVGQLLVGARSDPERGIYYAWPFLVGTRPSEQLGVLWEDVDLDRNVVHIRRMQERNGELTETTKTSAGTREVPLSPTLREMLIRWREICPRRAGEPHRVFPGQRGGALTYWNWRNRYFKPALARPRLPYVTPHSARHGFISMLQAQGVEVGLVAQLAGHANAAVTLGHYTQAVRGGADAVGTLESSLICDNM